MEGRLKPQPHDEGRRGTQADVQANPEPPLELCPGQNRRANRHHDGEADQADKGVREAEGLGLRGAHDRATAQQAVDVADRGVAGVNVNLQSLVHQNGSGGQGDETGTNQPAPQSAIHGGRRSLRSLQPTGVFVLGLGRFGGTRCGGTHATPCGSWLTVVCHRGLSGICRAPFCSWSRKDRRRARVGWFRPAGRARAEASGTGDIRWCTEAPRIRHLNYPSLFRR